MIAQSADCLMTTLFCYSMSFSDQRKRMSLNVIWMLFAIIFCTYQNKLLYLQRSRKIAHIWRKCFSQSSLENLTVFKEERTNELHSFLVCVLGTQYKCGDIASFIFFGFCQSLYLVNGNQLHTFSFLHTNAFEELTGKIRSIWRDFYLFSQPYSFRYAYLQKM